MTLLPQKVVLITGAGGGLGRAYALLFASHGARVVVNDLGGARDGTGEGNAMADRVVEEIEAAGGQAVANYGSVADRADARAMVKQAVDTYGQLDIVINNAGILRDKTLAKMTEEMWDLVNEVHLKGTFLVTQAAVEAMMRAGKGGRIINTSSYAGLKGNFGQANYGAAKAGIAGFTRVVALETRKAGITVNAVAPVAKTRMTEEIKMVPEEYEPEDIAPLVCWLASDGASDVTGRVFGAHGSHYFEYNVETTEGVDLGGERWSPSAVGDRFDEITRTAPRPGSGDDPDDGSNDEVRALFEAIPSTFKAERAGEWSATIVFDIGGRATYSLVTAAGESRFVEGAADGPKGKVTFASGDVILDMARGKLAPEQAFMQGKISTDNMGVLMKFGQYFDLAAAAQALGNSEGGEVGEVTSTDLNVDAVGKKYRGAATFAEPAHIVEYAEATDADNDRYDPESDNPVAHPIFPVRLLHDALGQMIVDPDLNADLLRLVHGEQDMRFHRHLRPWDLAAPRAEITEIVEKTSGYLVNVRTWLMVDGEETTDVTSGLFIRKEKREGGAKPKDSGAAPTERPERSVLFESKQVVADDQPRRYAAASLDDNPIHLDEEVAKSAGLPSVILHGLCTMAFAANAIVDGPCEADPDRLARLKVRFSKPVLPGWELTTRIWKENEGAGVTTFGFDVVNQDGERVITNAVAEVR